MRSKVETALKHWGMDGATYRLIAARENHVFRIDFDDSSYALRLHRQGYRSDAELLSELQWMSAVFHDGLSVPTPIASVSGDYLNVVEDIQIDMLTWLAGAPLGAAGKDLQIKDRPGQFRRIGREMANLHKVSDGWTQPPGFRRPAWDRPGLVGEAPVWDRFWDNPTLSNEDRELFLELRRVADAELADLESQLDFGLIHADLVRENIMIDGDKLQFIDFDDGGFGFRLFDLATTLMPNLHERDYPALKAALFEGYRSVREIDTGPLDLFLLLRSTTYVGWIITRMGEEESADRNERFVDRTRMLCNAYLSNHTH